MTNFITFRKREEQERIILQRWFNSNNEIIVKEITKVGSKKNYDAAITYKGVNYLVEMKNRGFNEDKYESAIIDKTKYENLLNVKKTMLEKKPEIGDIKILYIAAYNDGNIIYIWDMSKFSNEYYETTSKYSSGINAGASLITKPVLEFLLKKGKRIDFINN